MSASIKAVDMSNVKERSKFNRSRLPAGDYLATVVSVEDAKSSKTKEFMYEFAIKIDKRSQSVFPYYCLLQENQLWKLRNLLVAAGISVPKSRTKINPNLVVGKKIGVTIEDADDYKDREQSELTAVFPAAELTDAVLADDSDDDGDDDGDDDTSVDLDDDFGDDAPADDEPAEDEPAEDEPEADDEPVEEAAEGDEWDAITDRLELRKALKKVAPDEKTSTKMTEDDIRDLIRKHSAPATETSDEDLEELDIDDL